MSAAGDRVPGLHGVVYVEDLARCTAFYAAVAGLEVVERGEGFVTLTSSDVELALVRMAGADPLAARAPRAVAERRAEVAVKLSFPVPSLDAAAEQAGTLGGLLDPADTVWEFRGWRHRHGIDPEGNVVSFRETAG